MDLSALLSSSREIVQIFLNVLLPAITVLVGAVFIYSGLKKVVDHSHGLRHGQSTVGPVLINLGIGAVLIRFSFMLDQLIFTIFQDKRESPSAAMSYMPAQVKNSGTMLNMLVEAAVWWIVAIGAVAVFRGFILWNDLAKGQGGQSSLGWKGFWHLIFGAACVNFSGVLKLFSGSA